MNGELAQVIAVATYGSAWFRGLLGDAPPALESTNSTFQYVREARFELGPASRLRRPERAGTVAAWLLGARQRGIDSLGLVIAEHRGHDRLFDEHMLVAFSGGGRWLLIGSGTGRGEVWRASWEVGNRGAPDHRIWDVTYRGMRVDRAISPPRPGAVAALGQLTAALAAAEHFAVEQDLGNWADGFRDAIMIAEARHPVVPYHPDMLPPGGTSSTAARLVAMATRAWVFGGMGSWNDLAFADPVAREYTAISRELYAAVLNAFVAAVNATFREEVD